MEIDERSPLRPFPSCLLSAIAIVISISQFYMVPLEAKPNAKSIVDRWATTFGDELNWLAKNMTKADEIKKQYKENNAKVEEKGDLIQFAVQNVGRMFHKKTVAVRCIANKAEELAEEFARNFTMNKNETTEYELQAIRNNYQYYSSKYSMINGIPCANRTETKLQCNFKILKNAAETYLEMQLKPDKHFYHISVNTSHTSVHVPTNVFDGSNETKDVLIWTKGLDQETNNSKHAVFITFHYLTLLVLLFSLISSLHFIANFKRIIKTAFLGTLSPLF